MNDIASPTGIYIRVGVDTFDIGDPLIPRDALDAWLDQLNIDQLRTTIRILLEKPVGFDAGVPGAGD